MDLEESDQLKSLGSNYFPLGEMELALAHTVVK